MTARVLAAEAIGTAFLVATVIGSGIMAARLSDDVAVALLCNAVATGAMLTVLILVLRPVSGAEFNPVVTLAGAIDGAVPWRTAGLVVLAQIGGGVAGTIVAHAMFELPVLEAGTTGRAGAGQWLGEAVATFGLLLTILGLRARNAAAVPAAVGLYIAAAYWFTSSTSFANPAVTVARSLSDTFAGIAPGDVPAFVVAQVVGGLLAIAVGRLLWPRAAVLPGATAGVRAGPAG